MRYAPLYPFEKGVEGHKSFLGGLWAGSLYTTGILINLIIDTPNARSRELCIAFPRSPAMPALYWPSLLTPHTAPAHRCS